MAIQQLNLAHENQLKPLKFQGFKQKAHGFSFWAFLFSIFIFISIFHVFKLSPSSLLSTTRFWFFISNALILIIAVDFGASKKQAEIYEEYVEKSMSDIIRFPSFECRYPAEKEIANTNIPSEKEKNVQETEEEVKEVIVDAVGESESRERKMQVVVKDDMKMSVEEAEGKMVEFPQKVDHGEIHEAEKEIETGNIGQEQEDDDDEYSKMSNEELNRRVEEFIQRFNKQIRLQAAQNRIQHMQRGN